MKSVVPTTTCSAKYGRPAAPRAAPICPGETLTAGRAVSGHSHGKVAASEAVAICPGVRLYVVDCVSYACPGAASVCVMEAVPTIAKVKGISEKGHAAQNSKGRKG